MNKLMLAMQKQTNRNAVTENGAVSLHSSLDCVLDFFSKAGAIRNWGSADVENLFGKAYSTDKLMAIRSLFYCRDIRGGLGERKTFYTCMKWIANYDSSIFNDEIFDLFAEYGRWDDLFCLKDTPVYMKMLQYLNVKFTSEIDNLNTGKKLTLLAKYMPSVNAGRESKMLAKDFLKVAKMPAAVYRKNLSAMRASIGIVESKMCAKQWGDISYQSVPSQAAKIYRNAFKKHDKARYDSYLEDVKSGKAKINASTIYPCDLVGQCFMGKYDETIEAQWNSLPNYVTEDHGDSIVVCDVSGSMTSPDMKPISAAISLALYFAERNKGAFANQFITFSTIPAIRSVVGCNLMEKVRHVEGSEWSMSTNIQGVFDLILDTAKSIECPSSEMPETIYIISDMQFDSADPERTNFEVIEEKYKNSGYTRPNLVFWNVSAGKDMVVTYDANKTALVSGYSPIGFKHVVSKTLNELNPLNLMLNVLNSERYSAIKI